VLEEPGTKKLVTVGAWVSGGGATTVIVTFALLLVETLPAASLAQAKRVFEPGVVKVRLVGGVVLHPGVEETGALADSVTM
jgi:hypothetical protein